MLPFSANPVINSFQKNETLSGAAPVWPMTFTFGLFTSAKFPKNINDCTEEPSAFHKAFDNVGLLQQLQQTQTSFSHQDSRFSQGVEKFIYKPLLFSIWEVTEKKKKRPWDFVTMLLCESCACSEVLCCYQSSGLHGK